MAQVPTYDAPTVESRALPAARSSSVASPAMFNGAAEAQADIGKGLMAAGTGIGNVLYKMQERENAESIFQAETSFKDSWVKQQQSVNQRRGADAKGVTAETEVWFAEQEKEHSKALTNDLQRQLFSRSITRLRQANMGVIASYEEAQGKVALESASRASVVGTIDMAAADASNGLIVPGNPDAKSRIDGYIRGVTNNVAAVAQINGWTKEQKDAETALHMTNLHKQVIQGMVDKNPDGARSYFNEHKGEIKGSELDAIERVLNIGGAKQAGFQFAERINYGATSESAALAAARKEFADSPEKREAAIAEVKTRYGERKSAYEYGQRMASDQAWKIVERQGFEAVPAGLIAGMDGRAVIAMRDFSDKRRAGIGVVTDPATYYDLRTMAANDPNNFKKLDLTQFVNKMSQSDFQEIVKLQTNDNSRTDAATLTQQLSVTHNQMKWGSSQAEKKGAFDMAVQSAVDEAQKIRGKKLDYKERQEIIDRMLISRDNTWTQFGKKQYFEVPADERKGFVPSISSTDRAQIVARFKTLRGRNPTEDEVVSLFKEWKGL